MAYKSLTEGDGSSSNRFKIYTVENFIDYISYVYTSSTSKDWYAQLQNDLNFSGITYPIFTKDTDININLFGNGYKITGLTGESVFPHADSIILKRVEFNACELTYGIFSSKRSSSYTHSSYNIDSVFIVNCAFGGGVLFLLYKSRTINCRNHTRITNS